VRGISKRMGQVVSVGADLANPLTLPALTGRAPPSPASGRGVFGKFHPSFRGMTANKNVIMYELE
jgi:hypothetical protein